MIVIRVTTQAWQRMTEPPETGDDSEHHGFDRAIVARFNQFTGGFWRGETARMAWFWSAGLALCLVVKLGVDVAVNRWNRMFFDALERRDAADLTASIAIFAVIALCSGGVGAGIVRTRETLQVWWRQWVSGRLLDEWIEGQRFFRMTRAPGGVVNPEYRISDDVRLATEPLVDFAIGLFTALLAASTFVGILWSVGGSLELTIGGTRVSIPAFMVLGALAYGVTTSTLVPLVGRSLPRVTAARNESEALFRAETIHLRENAEGVALARAEGPARERLDATYATLARNWLAMVRQHVNVTWVMNANTALIPVFPLVLATPKYLTGELSLGQVVQLASAFAQVQIAIGWLAENYRSVAEWFASARRVVELVDGLEALDADAGARRFSRATNSDGTLEARGLTLFDRPGATILRAFDARLRPGDRALIAGVGGAGKSALARAIGGFWFWGQGTLALPGGARPAFAAAAAYLSEGRLADAIMADGESDDILAADIAAALASVGAPGLAARLDERGRWMLALSQTEKQLCAIARLMVRKPAVIVIEDALSAVDSGALSAAMRALFEACPRSIILDFSNKPAPAGIYNRQFDLAATQDGSTSLVETTREVAVSSG